MQSITAEVDHCQDDPEKQNEAGDAGAVSDLLWQQTGLRHPGHGESGERVRVRDLEHGGQLCVPALQHDQQHDRGQGEARPLVPGRQDDPGLQSR